MILREFAQETDVETVPHQTLVLAQLDTKELNANIIFATAFSPTTL